MKRTFFYMLLILQIAVIIFFIVQLEAIEKNGRQIEVVTVNDAMDMEDIPLTDSAYFEYKINRIPKNLWHEESEPDINKRVNVLLKQDEEGIYQVHAVSSKKISGTAEDEVMVSASYSYTDENGNYYVTYGFEEVDNIEQYGQFYWNDELKVTIVLGKWGQQKIVAMEKTAS